MSIKLGPNRYGKSENRVVRVTRNGGIHEIRDLNVSVALSGEMDDVHLTGDNAAVLPTDTQKNTVFAFAKEYGITSPEAFALLLARHFVDSQPTIRHARVSVEEYLWERIVADNGGRQHSFVRSGREIRTARVHYDGEKAWVASGLKNLVVLNSTGSEFHGYIKDKYTTLQEAYDRILATEVNAEWRHRDDSTGDWDKSYHEARTALLEAFATTHSLSLQQTLYAMGDRALQAPELVEVRLSLPNKHHFAVDLAPFDLTNENEVFFAADRPYGLIEGTVLREDAPDAGPAWD